MNAQRLNPPSLPTPAAAYSQVVRKGTLVTTAGQIAFDADSNLVGEGDIGAQTRQTLDNLQTALEAAGSSLDDVVKVTVFLSDMVYYQGMNSVFNEYFQGRPPAPPSSRAWFCHRYWWRSRRSPWWIDSRRRPW